MKDITEEVTKAAELTDEEEIYRLTVNKEVYIDDVSWGKVLSKEDEYVYSR